MSSSLSQVVVTNIAGYITSGENVDSVDNFSTFSVDNYKNVK